MSAHLIKNYFLCFSGCLHLVNRLLFFRKAFSDELALLQKIRHPNVVQFLGAVTQSSPMMIVTEFLPKVFVTFSSLFSITYRCPECADRCVRYFSVFLITSSLLQCYQVLIF